MAFLLETAAAVGGLDGTNPPNEKKLAAGIPPTTIHTIPSKRDDRFPDPYNMGVNAEVFLYDAKFPPEPTR